MFDGEEQLDALADDWYGPGSVIIITTRDAEVLKKRQVNKIQAMEGLSPEEGMKLFSLHAFGRESPEKDYGDITQQIVHACDRLPLSLEILGAHLRSKRNFIIWNEALQQIRNVSYYEKLYKSLRISYDALRDDEKQIFLDIACFFIRSSNDRLFSEKVSVKFWKALERKALDTSLKILEGKSLIVMHKYTLDWRERTGVWPGDIGLEFRMHDHLRDLGRQIVVDESPDKPLMCSRLWDAEDIISAIGHAEETSTVQGIMCRGMLEFEAEQVDSLFSTHSIKFMFCWNLLLEREITNLPQNLRYLVFSDCEFSKMLVKESYLPKAIYQLEHLRYLDMSDTQLWFLPIEFGRLPSLEELYLSHCSLIELPHSFGDLIKLKFLDISSNGLKILPANFSQLRSLEYLNASNNEFEELPALPEGLLHLDVTWCQRLTELPKVDTLHSLTMLSLDGWNSLKELPALSASLTELSLLDCGDLQRMSCMRRMKNLLCLGFDCSSLDELPELEGLQSLEELELEDWKEKKLPILLPSGLIHLSLSLCQSLIELMCMSHMRDLETLHLTCCISLIEIPKLDTMHSLKRLHINFCCKLEKLLDLPSGLIHPSLDGCQSLIELPCMSHMRDLETLDLTFCKSLIEIPKLDTMHSVR